MEILEIMVVLLCGLVVCGFFVLLFVIGVLTEKKQKEDKARSALAPTDASPQEQAFDAKVVDMQCRVVTVGTKSPKAVSEYLVYFERADGTVCCYPVSEKFYQGFEIGQTGRVTLVDGALYGFSLSEESAE